jgi:hypothetical protein
MDYITPIVTQAEQFDVQKELQAQTLTGKSASEAQAHLANKYQQEADIEFQRWAKEADLSHLQLLEGNRSAATAGQNYSNQLADIYSNPDTTTLQKQESARLLSEAFTTNLELIEATSKIDLSKFLPDFVSKIPSPADPVQVELDNVLQRSGWEAVQEGQGDFNVGGYGVVDTTGSGRSLGDLADDVSGTLEKYSGTFALASMLAGPVAGAIAVAARVAYDKATAAPASGGSSAGTGGGPGTASGGYGGGQAGGEGGAAGGTGGGGQAGGPGGESEAGAASGGR